MIISRDVTVMLSSKSKSEPKCLLHNTDLSNTKLQRRIGPELGEGVKNIPEKLLNRSGNDKLVEEYLNSSIVNRHWFNSLGSLSA